MLSVIGHLLPIALAVAISSVPIMATILILLSPKRDQSALPFLIGWMLGMAVVVALFTLGAQAAPTPRAPRAHDAWIGTAEILVGVALLVVAVVSWRRARRDPSEVMPKWLHAVGTFGPWPAFGTAFALNFRPKGLLLAIAAGLVIESEKLTLAQAAIAIAIYTIIGASTVAVPIIVTLAEPERMAPRLLSAKEWVARNSRAVTALILMLIAVVIIGTGIGRL